MGIFNNFKKKKDVGKIYRTTDGYLDGKDHIKKPRRVVAVEQRNDTAIGVLKIYSEKDKHNQNIVKGIVLKPKNHISLTEDSVVGSRLLIGKKNKDGSYEAFFPNSFREVGDKLTKSEIKFIQKNIQNDTKKHRRTYKKKVSKWKKNFK